MSDAREKIRELCGEAEKLDYGDSKVALLQQAVRLADELQHFHGSEQDWARGLAALLKDRQALDKALGDPARLPSVPPGMPIGTDDVL